MSEAQSDYWFRRDFQVTLRASNPRFLSYLSELASAAAGTYVGNTTTFNVAHRGNLEADPVIRIYGSLAATTNGGVAATLSRTYTDNDGNLSVKSIDPPGEGGDYFCHPGRALAGDRRGQADDQAVRRGWRVRPQRLRPARPVE